MSKASNIMTVKVLPDHFANEAQEIWLPACFAIPWLLGQQVRHKKQQLRQTKENGLLLRRNQKISWSVGTASQETSHFHVGPFSMHTTTLPDIAGGSCAIPAAG